MSESVDAIAIKRVQICIVTVSIRLKIQSNKKDLHGSFQYEVKKGRVVMFFKNCLEPYENIGHITQYDFSMTYIDSFEIIPYH